MDSKQWAVRYHYRDAGAVDSCDLCSYAVRIDADNDERVEALTCSACSQDTGTSFAVDFGSICDNFLPEMLEDKPEDEDD